MPLPLPAPDDPEFLNLIRDDVPRRIYKVLFDHQDTPLDIAEIRAKTGVSEGTQEHFSRRLRFLYPFFEIDRKFDGPRFTYRLVSATGKQPFPPISKTLRAEVLRSQRCAQCGRTPIEDHVKLHVDHKIPQEWGGSNEIKNLQALCSECNEGKKNFYGDLGDEATESVLGAANFDEPHRRIGEALRRAYPEKIRSDVLDAIASSKQYQDDWQKRARELRELGWKLDTTRQKEESGRVVSYYFLEEEPPPLPEGKISPIIRKIEREKATKK